jgi:hypothetical protein
VADILLTDEEIKITYGKGISSKIPEWDIWAYGYKEAAKSVAQAQIKKIVEWLKIRASFHSDNHMAYMRLSWNEWRELEEIGSA